MRTNWGNRRGKHKNERTKVRNAARRQWRRDNPGLAGKQLKCWPLPTA